MPNPFATDSGNQFAGYTGTIADSFAMEGQYGKQINWVVQLSNPELFPQIQGGSQTVYIGIDDDWELASAGTVLSSPKPNKKPGKRSDYGLIMSKVDNDIMDNSLAFKATWGEKSVLELSNWKGYEFLFDEVEIPYGGYLRDANRDFVLDAEGKKIYEKQLGVKTRILPVMFVGYKGAPATNGQVNVLTVSELNLDADFEPELTGALDATSDYKAFIDSFSGPSFAKAFKAVPDAGVYTALKAGSSEEPF